LLAFTTDQFRPAERFEAFTEELARRAMRLDEVRRRVLEFLAELG